MTRDDILDALGAWIDQRPGLDPHNYISHGRDTEGRKAYFAEARQITRQLNDARTLLAAVRWRTSIDVPQLKEAFRAFSGRLSLHNLAEPCRPGADSVLQNGGCWLEYCTGQYWPTEYRAAACAVLASALWDYTRANMPVAATGEAVMIDHEYRKPGGRGFCNAGTWIRMTLRREFGARIQRTWMD